MKQKRYLFIAWLAILVQMAVASPVSLETAKQVGTKFLNGNTTFRITDANDLVCVKVYCMDDGTAAFYVLNATNSYVIVSADNCAHPILGYSETTPFDVDAVPDALEFYLQGFVEQIQYGVYHQLEADENIAQEWELVTTIGQIKDIKSSSVVPPLITAQWGQGCYYNNMCPTDPAATNDCGHTLVGCVAVAMGQIMRYWGYPTTGNGSHTYTPIDQATGQPSGYPQQTANFGATTYQWSNMPNSLTASSSTAQVNAVSTLLWHCGVSVDMMYGVSGSGAFSTNVPNALQNYFRYSTDMEYISKDNYTNSQWLNLIKGSLDANRPVYYSGQDTDGQGGHAFICDGYNNNDYLHFNWGWYGNWNDYYAIGALNASGFQFNNNNAAIINIHPIVPSYQVTISPNPSNAGTVSFGRTGDRETVTYDFENNSMSGWTTIDADGDGQSWDLGSTVMGTGYGHNASNDLVLSKSYDNSIGALNPDNFLVSPAKATYGSISFYACAQDNGWPSEHFGVAVSTTTATASAFTTIQEWTMTSKGSGATAPGRDGPTRVQGNWYQYTVDLSAYSGQPIWVAIRHFNCSDFFYLDVDDITLSSNSSGNSSSAFFDQGQQCNVNATPNSGYYFSNWTENGTVVSNSANYTFTVNDARNLVANFTTQPAPQQYTITISANPSNGGSVAFGNKGTSNLDGITDGQWYYYDNGVNTDAIGTGGGSFWWGIMLPSGSYTGNMLTKVAAYDYMAMTGTASVYQGGTNAPAGAAIGTVNVTLTGSNQFVEYTFNNPVAINPQQNVWVVFYNGSGATYPAAVCDNTGDANGRWVSLDGSTWEDLASYGMDYTFMIRAYIEQGESGGSSAVYTEGQTCNVVATPNSGYTFTAWKENGSTVSTNSNYSFTVTGNRNLVANFQPQPQQYTINVSASPTNGGNVTGGGTYQQGQTCTVSATANSGYTFVNWTENGTQVSTNANYTFTVTGNRNLVANFQAQPQQYTINVSASPSNGGSVSGGGTYQQGQTCTVSATANSGYNFINWTENGTQVSTNANYTFTVTSNRNLIAHFTAQNYVITAVADPTAGGTVTGSGGYNYGESCTLTASANTGYTFINWTKNGTQVSSNPTYTFTVTETATYVAHFSIQSYTVTTSSSPSNGGTTTGGGTYNYGQTCTVTASAANGYTFTNWTENGTLVSTDVNYSFTVTSNRNLVANFAQSTHTIQASAGANGIITPSGSITVAHGANQSFAMIPDEDYEVQDVYIDGTSVGPMTSYTFTNVTADHYIHVTFVHVDGIGENSNTTVKVYPNPAKEKVTIEGIEAIEVQFYDALGQMVKTVRGTNEIDVSTLSGGLYSLRIYTTDGLILSRKIIVE